MTVPLDDPTNENSAIITYYETGVTFSDLKLELVNQVVMQVLQQPFFNELRTNQQLGYVVDARVLSNRHVVGYRFLVQSDKHSSEYLHNCVNQFIISKRKEINEISDADFE